MLFRDDFTDFAFDEIESSNFKVWITNSGELKQNMSPNFSDIFNTPSNSQIRYYEGTTVDKQDFTLQCAAIDITQNEWRAITEWLSPLKTGKLRFAWNKKHYYIVKVSSAPSGTYFVKGKIDPVMGQLFVVTFNLSFTTINDWAALSEYGMISNEDPDVNFSIFNNTYYMPNIVLRNAAKEEEVALGAQSSIIGADKIKIKTIAAPTANTTLLTIQDSSSMVIGEVKYDEASKEIRYYYKFDISNEFYIKIGSYDSSLSGDLTFISSRSQIISNPTTSSITLLKTNNSNIHILNTGTCDTYPTFYVNTGVDIYHNDNKICSFNKNTPSSTDDYPTIEIDNKSGLIKILGNLSEFAVDNNGVRYLAGVTFDQQCVIGSGRPELFKTYFTEDNQKYNSASSGTTTTTTYLNQVEAVFKTVKPLIYDRYKKFYVMIFDDKFLEITNQFNTSPYGEGLYSNDMKDAEDKKHYVLLENPKITTEKDTVGWKLKINYTLDNVIGFTNTDSTKVNYGETLSFDSATEANNKTVQDYINLNDYAYISICDYEEVSISARDTTSLRYGISLQTRDVI